VFLVGLTKTTQQGEENVSLFIVMLYVEIIYNNNDIIYYYIVVIFDVLSMHAT